MYCIRLCYSLLCYGEQSAHNQGFNTPKTPHQ